MKQFLRVQTDEKPAAVLVAAFIGTRIWAEVNNLEGRASVKEEGKASRYGVMS